MGIGNHEWTLIDTNVFLVFLTGLTGLTGFFLGGLAGELCFWGWRGHYDGV